MIIDASAFAKATSRMKVLCRCGLLLLALFAVPAFAADDRQIEALQTALNVCQQQTLRAQVAEMQSVADLTAQVKALQKRVAELEKKEEPKK